MSPIRYRNQHNTQIPMARFFLRAQPRQMRRQRVLVVGFGQVAQELAQLHALRAVPNGAALAGTFRPKNLPGGSLAPQLAPQVEQMRSMRVLPLALDLDLPIHVLRQRKSPLSITKSVVYCVPPTTQSTGADMRLKRFLALWRGTESSQHRRLVYLSTTGVYGDTKGAWVDETAPTRPASDRAKRRVLAEGLLRQSAVSTARALLPQRLRISVLRVPGIYGPERLPVERLQAGTPALQAQDDVLTNHITEHDLARSAWIALRRGASQRVYNVCDNSQMLMGEYFDAVADALGMSRPPRLSRAQIAQAVSPAMLSFMQESRRIHNHRLKHELRLQLRFATVQDLLATL